jgi:hypothetical protein
MKNKQVFYWIVDVIILVSLVLEYKLDWTGLQVHELLGLAVFAIMLFHLVIHWRWVFSVTEKVFESVSSKATFCYVIDFGLLFSFTGIIITGLIISSLLSLPLQMQSYEFWRFLHVTVSYFTLVMIGLKLAVHWKWLVNTTKRKIFRSPKNATVVAAQTNSTGISRRQFLAQTCLFSSAMLLSGVSYAAWMKKNIFIDDDTVQAASDTIDAATAQPQIIYVTATPDQQPIEADTNSVITTDNNTLIEQQLVDTNEEPTVVPTILPTAVRPAAASSSNTGSVRCNRGCSYPGHCRRYEDTNGNNICDLSEW